MNNIRTNSARMLRFFYERPLLFFLLLAIISYWPVAFMVQSLPHDVLNVVLPWRRFASECLGEGFIPLWNPYQQMGYPIHADLQYPIWYPEFFIIGSVSAYSNITLHILTIAYFAFAGLGVFKLAQTLKINHYYALLSGAVYMLSGIFVGYAQSMVSVIGAVWLPWVIAYYIRMLYSPDKLLGVLKLGLFVFLMLTGGYQAVSFMLFYLLAGILFIRLYEILKSRNVHDLLSLMKAHLILILLLIPLLAGMILSLYTVFPFLERLGGLSLESTQQFSFTPQSMISFFLPFAAVKNIGFFDTDISMTNSFVGAIIFVAAFLGIRKSTKSRVLVWIGCIGIIYLLASFGRYTPVQKWFYQYLPFMNLFKYASFYKFFFILALILFSGYYLSHIDPDTRIKEQRQIVTILISLCCLYIITALSSLFWLDFSDFSFFRKDVSLFRELRSAGLWEGVFVQAVIQALVLGVALILTRIWKSSLRIILPAVILVELILAVQLNGPVTVYGSIKPRKLLTEVRSFPAGFPIPDSRAIKDNSDAGTSGKYLYLNMGNYSKQVSADAWTSFWFKSWQDLVIGHPELLDSALTNPVLYLTSNIHPLSALKDSAYSSDRVFIGDSVWRELAEATFNHSSSDTVIITEFSPRQISCEVDTRNEQWLVLLQNNYPGWKAYVDDLEVNLVTVNKTFMGIPVPAGTHQVVFTYDQPWIRYGFIMSMAGFILLLLIVLLLQWKSSSARIRVIGILIIYCLLWLVSNRVKRARKLNHQKHETEIITALRKIPGTERDASTASLISTDDPGRLKGDTIRSFVLLRQTIRDPDIPGIIDLLDNIKPDTLYYARINTAQNRHLLVYLKTQYAFREERVDKRQHTLIRFFGWTDSPGHQNQDTKKLVYTSRASADSLFYYDEPGSFFIDSAMQYPLAADTKIVEPALPEEQSVLFRGRFYWKRHESVYLVVDVRRDDQRIYYGNRKLNAGHESSDTWHHIFCVLPINTKLKDNDNVKIYMFSPKNAEFWIDDIHLSYIRE